MLSFREEVMQLTTAAKELHAKEGSLHLESCRIIARLEYLGGSVSMGMTKEAFAMALGLSIDVYWKRAQAGRLMHYFPKVEDMVKQGEIQLSHVNLIAPHLTQANADILLERIVTIQHLMAQILCPIARRRESRMIRAPMRLAIGPKNSRLGKITS